MRNSKTINFGESVHALVKQFCKAQGYVFQTFCENAAIEKIKSEIGEAGISRIKENSKTKMNGED